jgi:hypothetical protein
MEGPKKPECDVCQRAYEINHQIYQPITCIMGLIDLIIIDHEKGDIGAVKEYRRLIDSQVVELRKRVDILYFINK